MPDFPDPRRDRGWPLYLGALVVALLLPVYWMLGPESPLRPEEIERAVAFQDTLERHLRSVPEGDADRLVERSVGPPATDPFRFGSGPPAPAASPVTPPTSPEEEGRDRWRVSAILTMRGEHVAIVNDIPVSVGDVLPDGVRVTSVTSDRVVLTRPGGERIVLPF